ncbi:MAG: hypothetical protein DME36_03475 [Verrucomicrobia bacterium]|nr:MAG: hypothetical protein DME36_03475 [Verrucomicrobiota bacterium]
MIDETFVLGKVGALFLRLVKERGALAAPVDPVQFASSCGVLNIEYRRMIPEAVLTAVEDGFIVYLQDNFILPNRNKLRERFSLAHELAHTFFYDRSQEVPKPMKGSPRGEKLERLCHLAASEILIPSPLLKKELEKRGKVESAEALLAVAAHFDVSLEVLMRKLHESRLFQEEEFAAVLVDSVAGKQTIRTACYGSILLCNTARPKRGADFNSWVLPLVPPTGDPGDTVWKHATKTALISARKIRRSNRTFILDLHFSPPPPGAPMGSAEKS